MNKNWSEKMKNGFKLLKKIDPDFNFIINKFGLPIDRASPNLMLLNTDKPEPCLNWVLYCLLNLVILIFVLNFFKHNFKNKFKKNFKNENKKNTT